LIALDAGQSGSRGRVLSGLTPTSGVLGEYALDAVLTNQPLLPQLARRTAEILDLVRRDGVAAATPAVLAVGSTGLATGDEAADLLRLVEPYGVTRVALAHDAVTCHVGALGGRPGAVVAAGTGVVTLAVGADSWARVDGWGHTLGDAGSGFWIGRAGLRAVLRAFDGRGPATALTPIVQADFPDLQDAYLEVQRDPDWVRHVASYARTVCELASRDGVCAAIVRRAASSLALSAVTALTRVGADAAGQRPVVSPTGKLFEASLLADQFVAGVRDRLPRARFAAPAGTALDGAAALFSLPAQHPLSGQVRLAPGPAARRPSPAVPPH